MGRNHRGSVFDECGAVLKGHFVLSSMEHSDTYLEKVYLYRNPVVFEELCLQMAREVASKTNNIEAVVGPAPIGAVLAQRVAYHLGNMHHKIVVPFFTEKDKDGHHAFRRNFSKDLAGKRVLVVDDVIRTGKTIGDLVKEVVFLKGQLAAVSVVCNRSDDVSNNFYIFPVISLLRMKLKTYQEGACPQCIARVPINANIERGREFLAAHPGYPAG